VRFDNASHIKVALVNMPLASIDYPSLALGIIKAVCNAKGHTSRVYNFNLLYAEVIGSSAYSELTDGNADPLGEQVFAQLLYPDRIQDMVFMNYISKSTSVEKFMSAVEDAEKFIESCAEMILLGDPEVVGFTTTFFQKAASLALARVLKKRKPDLIIALGGAACESPMGETLLEIFDFIDVVFHGEAEESLLEFLDLLKLGNHNSLEAGTGFSVRTSSGSLEIQRKAAPAAQLSKIPLPDYHDFVEEHRLLHSRKMASEIVDWQLPFEISRGCWWGEKNHCTFCGLNALHMKYRQKDIGRVESQLRELRSVYGERTVIFADNIAPVKIASDLATMLGSISGFQYFFEVKSNLREKELKAFARNRILHIQPGIERLNTSVLKSMRKGTSAAMNLLILRRCAELGIEVLWNYLLGFPDEEPNSLQSELRLLEKIHNLPPPHGAHRVRFDRYSPLFDDADCLGVSIEDVSQAEYWLLNGHPLRRNASYFFAGSIDTQTEAACVDDWSKIEQKVGNWKSGYVPNQLITFQNGEEFVVLDFRKQAGRELILQGVTAEVFSRARDGLSAKHIEDSTPHCRAKDALLSENLLVEVDGILVSLPTLVDKSTVTQVTLQ